MVTDEVVIGIDGGGTHTRVLVCDLNGSALAYCEKGGASIYKDRSAVNNVHTAIHEALEAAGKQAHQVVGLAAGIAGYDEPSDLDWIAPLTDLPGLSCPKWHVNDAVVAHSGALLAKPGIIVISGTGSIIVGITEDGRFMRNYDFHHYAASAARFIAYDAAYEVLAGHVNHTDEALIQSMLEHWNVASISEFAKLARSGFEADEQERNKTFGTFAPLLTAAAEQGSSVAVCVCDRAIHQIKVGIELLAAAFASETVEVAFIGSVANSPYFIERLSEQLRRGANKQYTIVEPKLPPAAGAILYAMNQLNQPITDDVWRRIQNSEFV